MLIAKVRDNGLAELEDVVVRLGPCVFETSKDCMPPTGPHEVDTDSKKKSKKRFCLVGATHRDHHMAACGAAAPALSSGAQPFTTIPKSSGSFFHIALRSDVSRSSSMA